jgi:hypothetical protein
MDSMSFDEFKAWVKENKSLFEIERAKRKRAGFIERYLILFLCLIPLVSFLIALFLSFIRLYAVGSTSFFVTMFVLIVLTFVVFFIYLFKFVSPREYNEYLAMLLMHIVSKLESHQRDNTVLVSYLQELSTQKTLGVKIEDEVSRQSFISLFRTDFNKFNVFKSRLKDLGRNIYGSLIMDRRDDWSSELTKIQMLAWYIFNNDDKMYAELNDIKFQQHTKIINFPAKWGWIESWIKIIPISRKSFFDLLLLIFFEIIIISICIGAKFFLSVDNNTSFLVWGGLTAALVSVSFQRFPLSEKREP